MTFQEALVWSASKLTEAKADGLLCDFAIIGGLALARVAVPRATADIGYIVRLGEAALTPLAERLKGTARTGDASDPLLGAITFHAEHGNGLIPVQLIQFPAAWERIAFQDVQMQTVAGAQLPFVSWRTLLLLKLYAGSPLDLQDAEHILLMADGTDAELTELRKMAARLRISSRLSRLLTKLNSESETAYK